MIVNKASTEFLVGCFGKPNKSQVPQILNSTLYIILSFFLLYYHFLREVSGLRQLSVSSIFFQLTSFTGLTFLGSLFGRSELKSGFIRRSSSSERQPLPDRRAIGGADIRASSASSKGFQFLRGTSDK